MKRDIPILIAIVAIVLSATVCKAAVFGRKRVVRQPVVKVQRVVEYVPQVVQQKVQNFYTVPYPQYQQGYVAEALLQQAENNLLRYQSSTERFQSYLQQYRQQQVQVVQCCQVCGQYHAPGQPHPQAPQPQAPQYDADLIAEIVRRCLQELYSGNPPPDPQPYEPPFSRTAPVFSRCLNCHSGPNPKGGFALDTDLTPRKMRRAMLAIHNQEMPRGPQGTPQPLTDEEADSFLVEFLQAIQEGAQAALE